MKPNKFIKNIFFIPSIIYVLIVGFLFRILISSFGTLQLDQGTFIAWGQSLVEGGFKNFYNGWSDYLPGYLYVLWLLAKINLVFPNFQTLIFKLPAIIADIGTGYLIYKILNKDKSTNKWGVIGAILYIFNPAVFSNSSLWGQVDSLTSMFTLFSVYIFPTSYILSAISLSVGTLIKPQAAFILPAILYLFLVHKRKVIELLNYGIIGLSVFVLGFLPFSNQSNLFLFILNRLSVSSGQYQYGSVNAFTFWGLFGFWKPDTNTFIIGIILCILIAILIFAIVLIKKPKNGEYVMQTVLLLGSFLFLTRIHERHLLPTLAPLLVICFTNPFLFITYFGLSFTYLANLYYAFVWITENFKSIFGKFLINFFILINIFSFAAIFVSLFKKINLINFKLNLYKKGLPLKFATKDINVKTSKVLLSLILLFSLISRTYSLGTIKEMYFDEIYHSFTAKLVLHNDPKAWEFWNPNPEGFAYEWTHPPISKLGMVVGMKIFGENSFGWRIPQAVLGTISVYLIYLLALVIFKDRLIGLLSATVFSLDGLPLVLSRMGMNDSYVLVFSLLSVYLFIKDEQDSPSKGKVFWSAFAFGLAIASKWSGVYTFPIIVISHFVFQKKIKLSYLSFLVVPIAVYILSYSFMFSSGHTWLNFIDTQKQMWWYHTGLVATHPYTSPAWSWPLLLRPIYLYDGPQELIGGENTVARIYAFGNPIVFWFGLFSIVISFFIAYRQRNKRLGFVLFSYLIFFLPWIASPRIMFLYHYLPSIPFLAIATGFVLRTFRKSIFYFVIIGILFFLYFYPHWAGIRIPEWLDTSYYWFDTWR